MMNEISNFILYTTPTGDVHLDILLQNENLWLTQKGIADLFGVAKSTVSEHLSNIYSDGELDRLATVRKFRTVQKEGNTAAEIVYHHADASKEKMGLTTWKNAPDGRILKSDVLVAKNYLQESEIRQLERTVTSYFDYIEGLVECQTTFTMQSLAESIDRFLSFNEYKILEGKGKISKKQAEEKAGQEYEKFNRTQKIVSDFDKQIQKLMAGDTDA